MDIIKERVSNLFVATDNQSWDTVESIFAPHVILDYSSLNGIEASNLPAKDIIDSWKKVLPGFTHTHHQIGNFLIKKETTTVDVFCYGIATHYLPHKEGNIWTVVGSYDISLIQIEGEWRISKMKFNFKYQEGNTALPQLAIEHLSNRTK